jgi:hypothetical protein
MPQPINRIVPDPEVFLDTDILSSKPELAVIVTKIFATWAEIEHSLSMLLVQILRAAESPAVAMFGVLTSQHLQSTALDAAAKSALPDDDYDIFLAVVSVCDSAQTPRNHLAHWAWGGCKQKPDLLCLADPAMIRERDIRVIKYFSGTERIHWGNARELHSFDPSQIFAYSKDDLERALRDLEEASEALFLFEYYANPTLSRSALGDLVARRWEPDSVRADVLRRLNERRLFREALARIRADRQKPLPPQPEPPPKEPDGLS